MKTKYKVIEAVSSSCESDIKVITGSRRTKKASYARDICAFILHQMGHSHEDIGRTLNRNRSSVTYMIRRVRDRINEDSNRGRLLHKRIRDILDNHLDMGFINTDE
jgi:chromosomal replication initiation ATPase DnaA